MLINNLGKFSAVAAAAVGMLVLGACSKPPANATADIGSSASAAPAAPQVACDRQCLIDATDAYVAALVAHDPTKAPLANNISFVENVKKMQPGEGLWKSIVKGPGTFAIHVPDPINETAGYLAMVTYMGPPQAPQGASPKQREALAKKPPVEQPAIIAIRLKFDDKGKITEAEHLVSAVRAAQMVNLQTPRPGIFTE